VEAIRRTVCILPVFNKLIPKDIASSLNSIDTGDGEYRLLKQITE
jgi:hypothetical protein